MPIDSGNVRMLVFCLILLSAFAGIISLIPNEFNANAKKYTNPKDIIPETWFGFDLDGYNFSDTWNMTLESPTPDSYVYFSLGSRNLVLAINVEPFYPFTLSLAHRYGFLLIGEESMNWLNRESKIKSYNYLGIQRISTNELNEDYEEYESVEFTVLCKGEGGGIIGGSSYFFVTALFSFNSTSYIDPYDAWLNDDLNILIGIDPQNSDYGKDIWYVISSIIQFNTIEVFGTVETYALILNGILWTMIFTPTVVFGVLILKEILSNWF